MKIKCKISKIIASALVMAIILSFGATGFAATFSTITTYNLDAEGTVDISSTVTGVGENEQVTYLATNGDGDIIYVDQEAAEEIETGVFGKAFSYTTTTSIIGTGTTSIKFGAMDTTGITPILTTDGIIANVDVAVTANDSVVKVNGIDVSGGFKCGIAQQVTFTVDAVTGYEVKGVKVNDVDQALAGSYVLDTTDVTAPSIVITTEEAEVDPALEATTIDETGLADSDVEAREVTLFSKIVLKPSELEQAEYGIIVLMSARLVPTFDDLIALGTKYQAYGIGSNNMFAVKLVGEGALTSGGKTVFAPGQTYVMAPYLTIGDQTVYGEMQTFTCGE